MGRGGARLLLDRLALGRSGKCRLSRPICSLPNATSTYTIRISMSYMYVAIWLKAAQGHSVPALPPWFGWVAFLVVRLCCFLGDAL